jgi:methylated-DNA-[protein]-cysteine S-methyltransferase
MTLTLGLKIMKTAKMTTSRSHSTCMTTIATPLGPMTLAATALGLCGAWFEGQRHYPDTSGWVPGESAFFEPARLQLAAYFAGQRCDFYLANSSATGLENGSNTSNSPNDSTGLQLDLRAGTAFQQSVWQALLRIPSKETTSYGGIALQLSNPKAVRAVGAAVGRNPVSIIVPCHRVLGADGSLTGYAGGLNRKIALLRLEGVTHIHTSTAHETAASPVQNQLL